MGVFDEALRKRLEQQPAIDAETERQRQAAREKDAHDVRVAREATDLFEGAAAFLGAEDVPTLPIVSYSRYPRAGESAWRFLGFGWALGRVCVSSDGRASELPQIKPFGSESLARSGAIASAAGAGLSAIERQHLERSDQYIEVVGLQDPPRMPRRIQVNVVWMDESAEYIPTSAYLTEAVADRVARHRAAR
ncbi:hypothetical protein GCM10025867_46550 (plasmid) [Frondihabitans sucicola]|uniref:Uncharacterized protein n=1 Tax=Frondihabitans sucicola TaxID=1268041 RepID=A0ABN6Y559_9MICO|nr:hypothetical protein [Frondihabitans sucicola]BDZ52414.1 hypothetical protein GCM10025867_46550 [Frondihabitans sucicola]